MSIQQIVKDTIESHKKEIEIIQWAIVSSIASIIYCEYLRNIRQRHEPSYRIMVPPIRRVQEILLRDGEFMKRISAELIDGMVKDERFKKYIDAPELQLFKPDNIEVLKTIMDVYMAPNVTRTIPDIIARKFRIGEPDNQTFMEDNDIDLFKRSPAEDWIIEYIIHESVLQLLLLTLSIPKEFIHPESNIEITMGAYDVLTVNCESAICPIHIDSRIIETYNIRQLFDFVLNTSVSGWSCETGYTVTSGVFNQVSITRIGNTSFGD